MNFNEYCQIDAINFSSLKSMRKSPKQYKYNREHGVADSVGKTLGRATHTAVLEPEKWSEEYAVFDGKIRKGKAWDLFEQENQHKSILKRDEADKVWTVAREVRANPVVKHYLSKGKPEHTLQWTDKATGLKCKARVDFLSEVDGKLTILDLKACQDVRAEHFRREAGKNGYHMQLGYYRNGVTEVYGQEPDCAIIAVEIKAPHDSAVFKLEDEALYCGFEDCQDMLQKVATCQATNQWPGCYDSIQDLVLRKWDTGISENEDVGELGLEFSNEEDSE